jgi:hypothetical protein
VISQPADYRLAVLAHNRFVFVFYGREFAVRAAKQQPDEMLKQAQAQGEAAARLLQ